jgi:glycosyltransferase involved in cell wall biosynthesis
MPVHNAAPHLDAAVTSISQQSYTDFEFVILDDASTDGSTDRLREWATRDSRIRFFEGKRNLGPVGSSNKVVDHARGSIIARMDADDICHPDRLRRELELLDAHPDVGLIGTLCNIIDDRGSRLRGPELWRVTRQSWFAPFPHGSMMFRRALFDEVGGYRPQCEFWEDQDLVLRMAARSGILVIADPLYTHRQSVSSTRITSDRERVEQAVDLMYRSMQRLHDHRPYDEILHGDPTRSRKLDPRVFISLGSLDLWSGNRPRLVRRLLKRGRLRPDFKSISALAWTAWAQLSPGTLRRFLVLLLSARKLHLAHYGQLPKAIRWAPPAI